MVIRHSAVSRCLKFNVMDGFELIAHQISLSNACLEKQNELMGRLVALITDQELLDKSQVIKMLKVSDSTYKRLIREGILKPMKLLGSDRFQKSDVLEALELSRQKGKL